MQWEQLTAPDLARAVKEVGVCVLPMGVLERHSDHLPLGTDYLVSHTIARLAAEKEPAVVFPPFYFGQIYEARAFPGAVTLRPTLFFDVVQGVCDEIGRNGFSKIIIYNGHGGNNHFLRFLAQCSLWEEKNYNLYLPTESLTPERRAKWQDIKETTEDGHAGENETSISLAIHPHLVQKDRIPDKTGAAEGRMSHLPPTFSGIGWYSNYPEHYAGDARFASEEKGKLLLELEVDTLAEYIAAVKGDKAAPALYSEYHRRVRSLAE